MNSIYNSLGHTNNHDIAHDYKFVSRVDPAEIPLSLTLLKQWLRMDTSDTSEDAILQLLVDQAVSMFEAISKRTLMNSTFITYRNNFYRFNELRKSKLVSITSVKYIDSDSVEQTIASSNYYTNSSPDYSNLIFNKDYSYPDLESRADAVNITFVAGLSATTALVPSDIQMALMEHVAFLYENRGDCACDDYTSIPAQALSTYRRYQIMEIGA